jgi:3-isopropylmalate/(R)-2-methylmalate dehydratase small subunit
MEPFTQHRGIIAVVDRANIDTDQIIPKQFLKAVTRQGFGENLFFDWRYGAGAKPNPDFELNKPRFAGASILIAGNNFGCGSSREHAVWALVQYGFRAIIAPWREHGGERVAAFADIFRNNAVRNGLVTVELPERAVARIIELVAAHERLEATVDLENQKVTVHAKAAATFDFAYDSAAKEMLTKGLDEIGLTLRHEGAIAAFEARHDPFMVRR